MIFIDSNIWLYRLLVDPKSDPASYNHKRKIAIQLTNSINPNIIISTQVITETCSVLKRKANFSDEQVLQLIEEFEEQCQVIPLTILEIKQACKLRANYHISFWDSLIIANALTSDAKILYSEDMQHNLTIEEKLTIINPFFIMKE
jgi:predicted nucleic acid-binding protein